MRAIGRRVRDAFGRNLFDTVSWAVAIAGLIVGALLTNSIGVGVVVALGVAVARWLLGVWRTERTNALRTRAEQWLQPQRRSAGTGLALAAARAINGQVPCGEFSDDPANLRMRLVELARGRDPEGHWTPAETQRIRIAIEDVIRTFKSDVGPYAVDVPEARRDVQGVIDDLEAAADELLAVGIAANHRLEASWIGDAEELERRRAEVAEAVVAVRARLQSAVARAMRLIHLDDPEVITERGTA